MDKIRNENTRTRAGFMRKLVACVNLQVLRWFGHMRETENEGRLVTNVLIAEVCGSQRKPCSHLHSVPR